MRLLVHIVILICMCYWFLRFVVCIIHVCTEQLPQAFSENSDSSKGSVDIVNGFKGFITSLLLNHRSQMFEKSKQLLSRETFEINQFQE